jgi:hypothetical protein
MKAKVKIMDEKEELNTVRKVKQGPFSGEGSE